MAYALEGLSDDWDGRGSKAPVPAALAAAREALALLQAGALARGIRWTDPHVGVNERGQIALEWWHSARSLTLTVRGEGESDYLKAWGPNIETEMEDGVVRTLSDFAALSRWLYDDEAPSE